MRSSLLRAVMAAALACAPLAQAAPSLLVDDEFVQGAFENPALVDPALASPARTANAVTLFSGHIAERPSGGTIPPETPSNGGGTVALVESSIGAPAPLRLGWVTRSASGEETDSAFAHHLGEGQSEIAALQAIFDGLYVNDGSPTDPQSIRLALDFDPDTGVNSQQLADLQDEAAAQAAIENFFLASFINPLDPDARAGVLDVPHFRSVALILVGNLELEKAFSLRFLPGLRDPGDDVIDDELQALGWGLSPRGLSGSEGAWRLFDEAVQVWVEVLANPILRQILTEDAPMRGLTQTAPVFLTDRPPNLPAAQPWPPQVYSGYKDLGAMARAFAQRGRVVNEISRRLLLKGSGSESLRQEVADLIGETARDIALQEGVLFSLFFPGGLPDGHEEDLPGLAESLLVLRETLDDMAQTRARALNTRINALGFDDDNTVILPGQAVIDQGFLTTYEYLTDLLTDTQVSPLEDSLTADAQAESVRRGFTLQAAEYVTQFEGIEDEFDAQLLELVGVDPDTGELALDTPQIGGGLIEQQIANIRLAENAVQRVNQQIANVNARIDIELERVARVNGILDRKAEMILDDFNQTVMLSDEIGELQGQIDDINAAGDFVNGLLDTLTLDPKETALNVGRFATQQIVNGVTGALTEDLEDQIAEKQREIERIPVLQEARNIRFEAAINDINSEAQVRTWVLELKTLEIDLLDAQITLTVEMQRLNSHYNRVSNLLARRERALQRLTRRSFADPIYRIETLDAALEAEALFDLAQQWLYLTARALEFKHSDDFNAAESTGTLRGELFEEILNTRTSEELQALLSDMAQIDLALENRAGADFFYWNYSLRREALGMTFDREIPGTPPTIQTPVEQFQEYLQGLAASPENIIDVFGTPHLAIPFSTVNFRIDDDVPGSLPLMSDIAGGMVQAQGQPVFDPRLFDDKIDWVQVNLLGTDVYTPGGVPQSSMPIALWYGGTAFLRTFETLTVGGTATDFLAIPAVRFLIEPTPRGIGWETQPFVQVAMTARVGTGPREAPDFTLRTNNFRERPVAATGWRLLLPFADTNLQNITDIEIIIVHRARTRPVPTS